jgi:hypothetical protein
VTCRIDTRQSCNTAGRGLPSALAIALLIGSTWLALPDSQAAAADAPATSLADYRSRLQALDQLVAACRRAPSPANCQSTQVGPDLQVAVAGGTRQVRLAWLRDVLTEAGKEKDTIKAQPAKGSQPGSNNSSSAKPDTKPNSKPDDEDDDSDNPAPQRSPSQGGQPATPAEDEMQVPTVDQQLEAAQTRLAEDLKQVDQLAGTPTTPAANPPASARHTLEQILAAKEYQTAVAKPTIWAQIREKIFNWLDKVFAALVNAGSKSKWIGYAAEIGFVVLVCVALVWFLIRIERSGRLGLSLLRPGPGAGAASARDWQLWLEDARQAAAAGAWRDAIHLLYWASISRLESSGLWPADRARTPREYLALLSPENAQRPDLAAISRSFELTWYGGRAAAEADFLNAQQLAARLGASMGAIPSPIPSNVRANDPAGSLGAG